MMPEYNASSVPHLEPLDRALVLRKQQHRLGQRLSLSATGRSCFPPKHSTGAERGGR